MGVSFGGPKLQKKSVGNANVNWDFDY